MAGVKQVGKRTAGLSLMNSGGGRGGLGEKGTKQRKWKIRLKMKIDKGEEGMRQ